MATSEELAKKYASIIEMAARRDRLSRTAGMLKEASAVARGSNVTAALKKVHDELESLVITTTNKPLTEAEKDAIARSVAEEIGFARPDKLRPAMKQASIDNAIVVVTDIEAIINGGKK